MCSTFLTPQAYTILNPILKTDFFLVAAAMARPHTCKPGPFLGLKLHFVLLLPKPDPLGVDCREILVFLELQRFVLRNRLC